MVGSGFINGETAYSTYLENPEQFHLLIIDIQLPGMNGFELAERITKENGSVPFLFLTARNEKKDRLHGLKIGAEWVYFNANLKSSI